MPCPIDRPPSVQHDSAHCIRAASLPSGSFSRSSNPIPAKLPAEIDLRPLEEAGQSNVAVDHPLSTTLPRPKKRTLSPRTPVFHSRTHSPNF
jgi:hypothetical protein